MNHQQYCIELLEDQQIISILQQQIASNNDQIQFFSICQQDQTPQFFLHNLVSPTRIIKYVKGQYCIYKAFYFQLFKLMFEIQNQQKDYLEIFKQIVFDPNLLSGKKNRKRSGKSSGANSRVSKGSNRMNNQIQAAQFQKQFKIHQKCIIEFIEKISQNQTNFQSFQDFLKLYPQADQSIIIILETFLQNYDKQMGQIDSVQSILEYLSQIFQISLVVFENCFKFQQSDVFLYIDQKQQEQLWIYIAYNQLLDSAISQQPQNQQEFTQNHQNKTKEINIQENNQTKIKSKRQQTKVQDQKKLIQQNNNLRNDNLNQEFQNNKNLIINEKIPKLQREQQSQIFQNQIQINKNQNKSIEFSNINHSISHLDQNTADHYGFFKNNNNANTSFHKDMKQNNYAKQYQKDKKIIQSEQILAKNNNIKDSNIITKQQSITEPYEYYNNSKFQTKDKLEKNQKSNKQIQNSFQVIESSRNKVYQHQISQNNSNPQVNESRTDTIINMFGDMLKSSVNVQNYIFNSGIQEQKTKQIKTVNKLNEIQEDYYKNTNMMKKNQSQPIILNACPNIEQKYQNQKQKNKNKIQIMKKISQQQSSQKNKQQQTNYMIDSQKYRAGQYNQYGTIIQNQNYKYKQFNQTQKQKQFGHKSYEISSKIYQNRIKIPSYYSSQSQNVKSQGAHIYQPTININKILSIPTNSSKYDKNMNYFYQQQDYINIKQKSQSNKSQNQKLYFSPENQKQMSIKSADIKRLENNNTNNIIINSPFMVQTNVANSPFRNIEQKGNIKNDDKNYSNNKIKHQPSLQQGTMYQKIVDKKTIQKVQLKKSLTSHQNQQEDFFYRPNGAKLTHQSRLKTIFQLQASKQTFKQSFSNDQKHKLQLQNSTHFMNYNPINTIYQRYSAIKSSFQSQKQSKYKQIEKQKQKSQLQKQLLRSNNRIKKYQNIKSKDFLDQDSLTGNNGTFYKQFTNTKILKYLKEPYKTKVQILKNRFKGEHRIQNFV